MPSATLSYNQRSVAWDRIASSDPFIYNSDETPISQNPNWIGVGLGFGMSYKKWFTAGDFSTLNRPDISFYQNTESRKPLRSAFIIGRSIEMGNFGMMPTISYMHEGQFNTLKVSLNANYKWLTVAGSYDWDNAVAASIGALIKKKVRLSYSYIMPTSSLAPSSFVSHEIGLSVIFEKPERGFIKNIGLM